MRGYGFWDLSLLMSHKQWLHASTPPRCMYLLTCLRPMGRYAHGTVQTCWLSCSPKVWSIDWRDVQHVRATAY